MTESNFRTYYHDARPLTFDRSREFLLVQTPDPRTAEILAQRFHTTIMRTVHNLHLAIDDVPIQDAQFKSRRWPVSSPLPSMRVSMC